MSDVSAEIPAGGSGGAGELPPGAEALGSSPELALERCLGEDESGEVAQGGGSGSKEGAIKRGWLWRLLTKCQAVLRKAVPCKWCCCNVMVDRSGVQIAPPVW